jgi:hypothetical protein
MYILLNDSTKGKKYTILKSKKRLEFFFDLEVLGTLMNNGLFPSPEEINIMRDRDIIHLKNVKGDIVELFKESETKSMLGDRHGIIKIFNFI